MKFHNSKYDPKRFPALIYRKKEPKSTALIFRTGKIVLLGNKNENEAVLASQYIVKDLNKALN